MSEPGIVGLRVCVRARDCRLLKKIPLAGPVIGMTQVMPCYKPGRVLFSNFFTRADDDVLL